MKKGTSAFMLLLGLTVLGSCERVKDKEAVADLPKTSVEDTLVLEPDTLEIDTSLTEAEATNYYGDDPEPLAQAGTSNPVDGTATGTAGPGTSAAGSAASGAGSAGKVSSSASTSASRATVAPRKRYVRPSQAQLQRALVQDARRSNRMDLPQLKNYWLKRQHYYRRASKEIKYVSGDTKIKISPEETKIETARGKVKIEGSDIKVKYD